MDGGLAASARASDGLADLVASKCALAGHYESVLEDVARAAEQGLSDGLIDPNIYDEAARARAHADALAVAMNQRYADFSMAITKPAYWGGLFRSV